MWNFSIIQQSLKFGQCGAKKETARLREEPGGLGKGAATFSVAASAY